MKSKYERSLQNSDIKIKVLSRETERTRMLGWNSKGGSLLPCGTVASTQRYRH